MNRGAKIAVGTLAVLGGAFLSMNIVAIVFLSDCQLSTVSSATSPAGRYIAVFEQRTCNDPKQSTSQVLVGGQGFTERLVAIEVVGTNDLKLTWSSDTRLIIEYAGATPSDKPGMGRWPAVVVRDNSRAGT